jgi:transposase
VQREVFFAVADLLNLEVDLILFDTSTTYFEIPAESEDDFRRFGESKDRRPDLPQVVVGFAVTKEGIPVRCFTFAGNASDQKIIRQVKDALSSPCASARSSPRSRSPSRLGSSPSSQPELA